MTRTIYTPEQVHAAAIQYTGHPEPVRLTTSKHKGWALYLNPITKQVSSIASESEAKTTVYGKLSHFARVYMQDLEHAMKLTPAGMELLEPAKAKHRNRWKQAQAEAQDLQDFLNRYTNQQTKRRQLHNVDNVKSSHQKHIDTYGYTLITAHESTTGETVAYIPTKRRKINEEG